MKNWWQSVLNFSEARQNLHPRSGTKKNSKKELENLVLALLYSRLERQLKPKQRKQKHVWMMHLMLHEPLWPRVSWLVAD